MQLLTLGHGTLAADEFIRLVKGAAVQHIVDVRTVPKSKRNPQYWREAMEEWVTKEGLSYRWEPQLGGFRRPQPHSKNVALRHPAFRGYADYMQTSQFWTALDKLLAEAGANLTAIMCSESLWWRCHRRLISDAAVLARTIDVQHLFHDGRLAPHHPTEGVRRDNGFLVYDSGTQRLI